MEVSNLRSTLAVCGMASEGDSILGVVYLNNQRVEEVKVCKSLNLKVTNVAWDCSYGSDAIEYHQAWWRCSDFYAWFVITTWQITLIINTKRTTILEELLEEEPYTPTNPQPWGCFLGDTWEGNVTTRREMRTVHYILGIWKREWHCGGRYYGS